MLQEQDVGDDHDTAPFDRGAPNTMENQRLQIQISGASL